MPNPDQSRDGGSWHPLEDELARTLADAFRTTTRALDDDARTRLQQTFRTAIGAPAAPTAAAPSGEGRIALRTFGAAEWRSE